MSGPVSLPRAEVERRLREQYASAPGAVEEMVAAYLSLLDDGLVEACELPDGTLGWTATERGQQILDRVGRAAP